MKLTDEQREDLEKRLANLQEQRDSLIRQAETGIAQLDGAMALIRSLLEPPPEQDRQGVIG